MTKIGGECSKANGSNGFRRFRPQTREPRVRIQRFPFALEEMRFRSLRFFRESTGTEIEIRFRTEFLCTCCSAVRGRTEALRSTPPRRRGAGRPALLPAGCIGHYSPFLGRRPRRLAFVGGVPCACRSDSAETISLFFINKITRVRTE